MGQKEAGTHQVWKIRTTPNIIHPILYPLYTGLPFGSTKMHASSHPRTFVHTFVCVCVCVCVLRTLSSFLPLSIDPLLVFQV